MDKKERRKISNAIMVEVMDLDISKYHIIFLANMILERIEHPLKKMDEIATKVMAIMPIRYRSPNKNVMMISTKKCLEALEEELHQSNKLIEISEQQDIDLFSGLIVKNTVSYFQEKILKQY